MKKRFITFEQKVSLLLRFGTLTASYNSAHYYFTIDEDSYGVFGLENDENNSAPFCGESIKIVVDRVFLIMVRNYVTVNELV